MAESILKLKVASEEYENKLKRASEGLQKYIEGCRKAGGTLEHLDDGVLDFVKALGSMETKSTSARGKISELRKGFIDMKAEYLHMTEAEKNGDIGKALSASLDQMKTRFHVAKNELAEINKELSGNKFGEFGNVIDTIGSKLGVTGNLTELLTSKTALLTGAVGAGIAVVTKATEAWASYNAELAKQDQITQVTTGLKGEDADRMTDKMRALSDTYNVDFREAVNAANTLMTQFGKTGDEATQLIKDGMRGMIQGDGPKLLSMIQNYAPAFRSAGLEASQLVAIIHNSEGGLFTDQNMQAIIMGLGKIRNMTKSTAEALRAVGIDAESMKDKMRNGSMTVFDALQQVGRAIDNNKEKTEEVGAVMQEVFGRQARTAGDNLGKAIANLNTNLEETKKQTGELGDALADLQTANEKLNKAIRDCFEYDGWDQMAAGIRSNLITALAGVLEKLAAIKTELRDLFKGNTLTDWLKGKFADGQKGNNPKLGLGGMNWHAQNTGPQGSYTIVTDSKTGKVISTNHQDLTTPQPTRTVNPRRTTGGKNTIKDEFTDMEELVGLIPVAEKKVKDLQQQIRESWDEGEIAKLTKELKVAEDEVKRLKDIGKPVDLEKMFPDYSKQNYNTGYAGSTKAKIDSARQDFALSTTNFDTINSYISGIKNALKDADLGSDLYNSLTEQLKDATTMSTMLQELMERGLQGADLQSVAEKFKTALLEGDVPDDKIKEYIDKLNEQIKNAGGIELSYNEKTGEVKDKDKKKSDRDVLKDSKQLVSGLSQVAGGLQQMGVKLPEEVQQVLGVVQGLMTVIEGVNTVIGITQTAALTANTTAMVALTSALWANTATSIIPFANGGIVPHAANGYFIGGTHMSGDVTPIMANAGELVLNRAQQGNLASQLSDGGGNGNLRLETYVSGRDLRIVLNNESQGRLKGKYVTSNNVR